MPKINEILLKWEGFQYANSPDLNMGYYYILLLIPYFWGPTKGPHFGF